ncbi:MAG: hypothetical protein A3G09_04130 [Candidatus Moranbacteria bacterium RIFCSPLOWO2_12_FULL_48_12]|nr:MAG: hypothetical protein A3G09_04130 [Candidatus Moranbacteria bacterium RIFCSPLOWO2_12_FULL_48_12]
MDIDTATGNIVLDSVDAGAGAILPEDDSEDDLGADATRWSTIFADTLNYSAALTDDNSAGTTVSMGDSVTLDTVTVTANTAITDGEWNVTNAGVANFVSVGATTAGTGTFTTLIGDTVQSDTTVSFSTNSESIVNSVDDTFTFTSNDSAVTITAADADANVALTVTPGGTGALTLGTTGVSGTTSITLATDGTGTGEVVLPDGAISTAEIADGTIADADTNGALTGAALAADTLVAGDIATGAVTTTEILDATIAGGDLAADIALTTTGAVNFSGASSVRIPFGAGLATTACDAAGETGQIYLANTTAGAMTADKAYICNGTTWLLLN